MAGLMAIPAIGAGAVLGMVIHGTAEGMAGPAGAMLGLIGQLLVLVLHVGLGYVVCSRVTRIIEQRFEGDEENPRNRESQVFIIAMKSGFLVGYIPCALLGGVMGYVFGVGLATVASQWRGESSSRP